MATVLSSEVASSLDLSVLRYSNVWEDHAVLEAALDVQPDDDVLSIASSGDNALNLLLAGEPRSLTAVDMSSAQIAVMQLKLAAIRHLPSHRDFLILLGKDVGVDSSSERRLDIYSSLRAHLPSSCSSYFDSRLSLIEDGLVSSGRLEKFFARYSRDCFSKWVTQSEVELLFNAKNLQQQRKIFESFPLDKLKKDFLDFYSLHNIAADGRHPAQMKYISDINYGEALWLRFVHVATKVPIQSNCYLSWALCGPAKKHPADPPYLQEKNFGRLHCLVDRVTVTKDTLENYLQTTNHPVFSKANLSDIFEYASKEHSDALFHLLVSTCRPGGRLAFWNLFTPRQPPDTLLKKVRLRSLSEMGNRLHEEDRLFYYSSFHVEEVIK